MNTNVIVGDADAAPVKSDPGTIKDAQGRVIVVKLLDPLDEYRLARVMGASADSDRATTLAMAAASVRSIDGVEQHFPNTERDIQSMLQRLGSDGVTAVNSAWVAMQQSKAAGSGTGAVKN